MLKNARKANLVGKGGMHLPELDVVLEGEEVEEGVEQGDGEGEGQQPRVGRGAHPLQRASAGGRRLFPAAWLDQPTRGKPKIR